jgi:hypothetical protein
MNDAEEEVMINNWWLTKCKSISKYILSYCFYIHIILLIILAIIQLRFSKVYKNRCTIDDRIILYLFVFGIIQIIYSFNGILLIIFSFLYDKYRYITFSLLICFIIQQMVFIFLIIWFIIGNYLVFRVKNIVQNTNSYDTHTYCDYTLYQIAFWTIIIYYIFIILFSIILVFTNLKCLIKKFKILKNIYPNEPNKNSYES